MGAIELATVDAGALLENDGRVAEEFDARTRLSDAVGPHPTPPPLAGEGMGGG